MLRQYLYRLYMQEEELRLLLEKYKAGRCTDEELEQLRSWYDSLEEGTALPGWDVYDTAYLDTRYKEFRQRIPEQRTRYRRLYGGIAAAAVLAGVLWMVRHFNAVAPSAVTAPANAVADLKSARVPGMQEATGYDRHLVLPDSSVVVLRAGSTISPAPDFNTKERRLTLQGEAYFDIRTDARKPFIVKAAGIYTYVLGTAFNIKSDVASGRVTVTVSSGKVRVEKDSKKLAILTKRQEVVLKENMPVETAVPVNTGRQPDWLAKGLLFNNMTLNEVCSRLSDRYQVTFKFNEPIDKSKRVTITDAFNGTEPLTEILDIVCTTLGYTYTVTDSIVTITV